MKTTAITILLLFVLSCKPTEDFHINMTIENRIPYNDYNYNIYRYGWIDNDTTTVDFEIRVTPYTTKGLADKHDNFWLKGSNINEGGLKEGEKMNINENIETDEGSVGQVLVQTSGENKYFWINNGDEVKVIAYDPYYFEVLGATGEDPRPEEPEPEPDTGGGGGGSGSATNCDLSNYQNQGMDTQYEVQCKAAYVYDCMNDPRLEPHCDFYRQLQQQLGLPDCPYCD